MSTATTDSAVEEPPAVTKSACAGTRELIRMMHEQRTAATSARSAPAQRIVRNSFMNLAGQGLYAAIYLIPIFFLARGLGADGFGEYFLIFALLVVAQIFTELGLSTVLTRRLAQAPEVWRETVAEAAGLFGVISLASLLLFVLLGSTWAWWRQDLAIFFSCLGAGVACAGWQVQRFCGGVLHAFESFGVENVGKILQGSLFAVLVVIAAWTGGMQVAVVVALLAVSHVVTALFMLVVVQRRYHCLRWTWSRACARHWLAEGSPLGLGDLARGLTWQVQTILLGLMQPAWAVGIYSMAFRPLGPINWVPRAIMQTVFPSFARLAGDQAALGRAFATSMRLLWVASLPIGVVVCVFAETIIHLLGGPDYDAAVLPLQVLIWITSLSFLSFQFRYLLTAVGQLPLYIRLVTPVLIVEVVLLIAVIPWTSYHGVCAVSVLGELAFTAAGLLICRRVGVGGMEWGAMLRALLAAALMTAVLWPAREASLPVMAAAVLAATGLYFGVCILVGAIHPEETRRVAAAAGLSRRRAAAEKDLPCLAAGLPSPPPVSTGHVQPSNGGGEGLGVRAVAGSHSTVGALDNPLTPNPAPPPMTA
jgi:O-antigen/teichoic acid export membrane protein